MQAIQDQLKQRKLDATLVEVGDREAGYAILARGDVDGFATDKLVLLALMQRAPQDLILLPEDLSFEPFAIVVPLGDWAFRLTVNAGLAKIFRSGALRHYATKEKRRDRPHLSLITNRANRKFVTAITLCEAQLP